MTNEDETQDIKDQVTDDCNFCHQDGGEIVIDPYAEEIRDERIRVRLHKECQFDLRQEI